jgi:streptogrisin C
MRKSIGSRLLAAAVLTVGFTLPATAQAAATPALPPGPEPAPAVSTAMSAAMQRDLHLTADQVRARLAREAAATKAEQAARAALGASYAGSWFDPETGTLRVLTTDATKAASLTTAGTTVSTAAHSMAELTTVKTRIDALAGKSAPAAINGWYVDSRTNSVIVTVNTTTMDSAATAFLSAAKAVSPTVRVIGQSSSPRPLADIVGAYPYFINNAARCSIGFTVTTGFVSAGHCGTPGSVATDFNGALYGTFRGSVFPGNDWSYVAAAPGVNLFGYMYGYDGNYYFVHGSSEVPEGSSICRSGSTTGLWCGTVQIKNQTVNYPQGTVFGLTQTNVCAEPGDSGGSWLSANQAQGVTSGGSGNCTVGGTTFFQPVNPILSFYGLSLVLT